MDHPINVLFLCTGNSARSILAESYLNYAGGRRFHAFSAGSFPKGEVHPLSLETLLEAGIPVGAARSKSWDEFARVGAPRVDVVISVCDNAAAEVCPTFPGAPIKAHWSLPDPAAVAGSEHERRAAFAAVFADIRRAIDHLMALPFGQIEVPALSKRLNALVAS
jgi:arsenate reductase